MRTLFIVVSKVYGLFQAYTGLTYIVSLLPLMRMFAQTSSGKDAAASIYTTFYGASLTLTGISMAAMIALTFGVAWLLLFRAEWLADRLRIPANSDGTALPLDQILHIGSKLIGLYVIVQGLPSFTQALFQLRHTIPFSAYMWSIITPALVQIAIGTVMVVKTAKIVKFITKIEK